MKSAVKESRRRRKLHSKKKIILFFTLLTIVVPAAVLSFFLIKSIGSPLYISPLALVRAVNGADDEAVFAKKLNVELRKTRIPYTKVDTMDGETYTLYLAEKGEVLLSSKKDLQVQIASLQVIYNRLTMEGKQFRKLDLRFSKPVVVLNGNNSSVTMNEVHISPEVTAASEASPSAQSDQ
jgi:hypothetical protein